MANKKRQFDLQFKKDAVKYVETHPDISHDECARNLNIGPFVKKPSCVINP